jgi:hypothetical protein
MFVQQGCVVVEPDKQPAHEVLKHNPQALNLQQGLGRRYSISQGETMFVQQGCVVVEPDKQPAHEVLKHNPQALNLQQGLGRR